MLIQLRPFQGHELFLPNSTFFNVDYFYEVFEHIINCNYEDNEKVTCKELFKTIQNTLPTKDGIDCVTFILERINIPMQNIVDSITYQEPLKDENEIIGFAVVYFKNNGCLLANWSAIGEYKYKGEVSSSFLHAVIETLSNKANEYDVDFIEVYSLPNCPLDKQFYINEGFEENSRSSLNLDENLRIEHSSVFKKYL